MARKIFKMLLYTVIVLAVLVTAFFAYQGVQSRRGDAPGLVDGRLARCPSNPNCICSEFSEDQGHFLPPLVFTPVDDVDVKSYLIGIVVETGGSLTDQEGDYLSATYHSRVFGFVDDLEFRVDNFNGLVHIRSASRVGKSDLGVNPARYRQIKERFDAAQGAP